MRSGRVVASAGAMTHAQYKRAMVVRASTHVHAHVRVYIEPGYEVGIPLPTFARSFFSPVPTFFFFYVSALHFVEPPRGYRMGNRPLNATQRNNFGDTNRLERNS